MAQIIKATPTELNEVTNLALELWPKHTLLALAREMSDYLSRGDRAVFLYAPDLEDTVPETDNSPQTTMDEDPAIRYSHRVTDRYCGLALFSLRYDYVEGSDSSPTGYLEGIYVREGHRRMGIAQALLAAGERWAMKKGCTALGSDCELSNDISLAFHLGVGFTEANRIVCLIKPLDPEQLSDKKTDAD